MFAYISGRIRAGEHGTQDASEMSAGRTEEIKAYLLRAMRNRRRPLAWLSLWRRRYLDGLIRGLQNELARRGPDG